MDFFIVRHGQTETNLKKLVCGQMDTKMTELGHQQVKFSSNYLKNITFDGLYVSPLSRAIETAKYFFPIENYVKIEELMEMDTGEYSSLTTDELWSIEPKFKYQGRYMNNKYPNGESLSMLYNRITDWIVKYLLKKHGYNDKILIVGHEATVTCFIHYFLQIPLDNYPSFLIPNGQIVHLYYNLNENQTRVKFLNENTF